MVKRSPNNVSGAVLAALLLGCATPAQQGPASTPPQPSATEPSAASAPAAAPAAAGAPSAGPEGAFAGCAAHPDEGPTRTLTIAGLKATQTAARLTIAEPTPDGQLVVGVLGPVNEDSGLNVLALHKYLAFFAQEKVEAVVVTGDVGEIPDGISRVLEELAVAKVPVLVIVGNRECQKEFADGVAQAQAKFDGVVNLNEVRSVRMGGVTFVSLPGYHDPNYITCETGCRYDAQTLQEVVTLAREAKTPVVLVSHGPPRGTSSQSLDFAGSSGNVGDPAVNKALADGNIAFGLYSNIKEAGARATAADLATQVPEGKSVKTLMVNPGPADTSRWYMNDDKVSYGLAAVVTYAGAKAKWKLFRAPKPTAAEKQEARALDPARSRPEQRRPKAKK